MRVGACENNHSNFSRDISNEHWVDREFVKTFVLNHLESKLHLST